ncbi:hypothetical protein N9M41_04010 [Rhodopirellula sp.]|nr:hypothetical protein [Rhodopirellula sp.]
MAIQPRVLGEHVRGPSELSDWKHGGVFVHPALSDSTAITKLNFITFGAKRLLAARD